MANDNLRVGADVHEHDNFFLRIHANRHQIRRRVRADVAGDQRGAIDAGFGVGEDTKPVGQFGKSGRLPLTGQVLVFDQRFVRPLPDRFDVKVKEEVTHGRVADHHHFVNLLAHNSD